MLAMVVNDEEGYQTARVIVKHHRRNAARDKSAPTGCGPAQ